jgi:hypothetical protein
MGVAGPPCDSLLELNIARSAKKPRCASRYYQGQQSAELVRNNQKFLDGRSQLDQFKWAVQSAAVVAPSSVLSRGVPSGGGPVKKKLRKKTRSKQKNIRKDTRPVERRPGMGCGGALGQAASHGGAAQAWRALAEASGIPTGAAAVSGASPSLISAVEQLLTANPYWGAKRIASDIRKSAPLAKTSAKLVRQVQHAIQAERSTRRHAAARPAHNFYCPQCDRQFCEWTHCLSHLEDTGHIDLVRRPRVSRSPWASTLPC